ncbi:S-adenosyl-L-methionine-dependentmethyltransferases superfamily protein, partial [Striga asiatica]
MAIARFGRQVSRSYQSYGLYAKLSVVVIMGLCFVFVWSVFSSFSVTSQRNTFDDIAEKVPASNTKVSGSQLHPNQKDREKGQESDKQRFNSKLDEKEKEIINGSSPLNSVKTLEKGSDESEGKVSGADLEMSKKGGEIDKNQENKGSEEGEGVKEKEDDDEGDEREGQNMDNGKDNNGELDADWVNKEDLDENIVDEDKGSSKSTKTKKFGPLFEPRKQYAWKLCNTRSKHNYIPCIDIESSAGRSQSYRHHERSCPKSAVVCLVPLPRDGYETPLKWPESKFKILYKNVAHPKLAAFVKTQDWLVQSKEYITFPHNQSVLQGGVQHYLESIEEMAPDIEWGKNIRVVLDVGCKDSSFVATLLEKDVLTLTLGLKDDLVDLGQIAIERGFPVVVSPFASRRLPFPSGVFDAIHCGGCSVSWHSNGQVSLFV